MISRRQLRTKVIQALYAHLKSENDNLIASEKGLMMSIEQTYKLYLFLLTLPVALATHAAQRQAIARQKKLPTPEDLNPNTRFVDNTAIEKLTTLEHTDAWDAYPEIVKSLYGQLTETEYFEKYMTAPSVSFKDDVEVLIHFFERTAQHSESFDEALEEISTGWSSDLAAALIMVIRTLQSLKPSQEVKVLPMFKSEEDRAFARTIFQKTLVNYPSRLELIEQHAKNWDVERIVFMDFLILAVAITELLECPDIPTRVTLDEYIDLSKYYSTPTSHTFVNGVLDKIANSLKINKL